ncbi:hypothetical protein [Nocardioides pantholopis]|uniref:hypothetical protein n=1 Tax=Nocardioides pantholopis TaxID=2483798 RepID=UPI001F156410|nr:hypothetical protein [Nocardioides pantholopis]
MITTGGAAAAASGSVGQTKVLGDSVPLSASNQVSVMAEPSLHVAGTAQIAAPPSSQAGLECQTPGTD